VHEAENSVTGAFNLTETDSDTSTTSGSESDSSSKASASDSNGETETTTKSGIDGAQLAFADVNPRPVPQFPGLEIRNRGPKGGTWSADGKLWTPDKPIKLPGGKVVKAVPHENGMGVLGEWAHKVQPEIVFSGNHAADRTAAERAWKAATGKELPKDYVFHHDPHSIKLYEVDGKLVAKGKMQLIPEALNKPGHVGGNHIAERLAAKQGIAEKEYIKIAERANQKGAKLNALKEPIEIALKRLGNAGKAGKFAGKVAKRALPLVGGLLVVVNWPDDVKAHGIAGAAARATPLLGDILTAYDLGKELADDIVKEALDEEARGIAAVNATVFQARDLARAAMSGALNRLSQTIYVKNTYIGEDALAEQIAGALQLFFNAAEAAYLRYLSGLEDQTQLKKDLQSAESALENSLRTATGDPNQPSS
jgi:hypothetical protein